ncbi:hypothetical protein [Paludisphaera rhizosphaerae]|uniref:hypothetical protein n=1 Tax=Paludisphaera rhizosphaerae TaxID=2711216 RepID=UPI0013ED32DA|nr:hypothetical protein [Paludisphaera rhizosphaerae]
MSNADRFIGEYRIDRPYVKHEWIPVVEHVIRKLSEFLDTPIRASSSASKHMETWAGLDIESDGHFAGGIRLSWKGSLAATVEKDPRDNKFQAIVFLFSHDKLMTTSDGRECLYLEYLVKNGVGEWDFSGWYWDEFEEFTRYCGPERGV